MTGCSCATGTSGRTAAFRSCSRSPSTGNTAAAGKPVALTGALDANVPSKPFGGRADYGFSPDGAEVVFAARISGRIEPTSTNFDVWRVPADGSAAPVNLTADNPAWDAQPAFSPDGRWLAHLMMERPGFEADRFQLVVRDAKTGKVRFTTRDWDRSIGAFRFSADGKRVYALTDHLGQHPLWSIALDDGARKMLTQSGSVAEFDVARDRIVFTMQGVGAPADLHVIEGNAAPRRLTDINASRLADVRFGEATQFRFAGAGGDEVFGYAVKPWNWEPGKKYPVAFIVHGGPQSSFANTWSYRWNPQVYSGAGYGVVFIDFHGSTGYGQAFTDSISGDWGGKPLEDLQKGSRGRARAVRLARRRPRLRARRVLRRLHDQLDRRQLAGPVPLPGQSRGPVRSPPRCTTRPRNCGSRSGTTAGRITTIRPRTRNRIPSNHVLAWKTPMLVIHGALDYRVPYSQGLATFTALQRRGIESRFLYFPDENHWISKPANSLQWHAEVLGWLDQHLK